MTLLRAILKAKGPPGSYAVLCGRRTCRGDLGRAEAAGAPQPEGPLCAARWLPPPDFRNVNGMWQQPERAARQYREFRKRGDPPRRGRVGATFVPLTRRAKVLETVQDHFVVRAPLSRRYGYQNTYELLPVKARCRDCGWPNIIEAPPTLDGPLSGVVESS